MQKLRLLIVDDEEKQRSMLSGFLTKKGYVCSTAGSAEDALKMYEKGGFEIALLDMKMPGEDGLSLMKKLKSLDPQLQPIMVTAYGTVETAVDAMQSGAFHYISKPIDLDELLVLIQKAGERHHLLRENLYLQSELERVSPDARIIGESRAIQEVISTISRVAPSDATVLVTGDSGTGKELAARALHNLSSRKSNRFVAVSCAALPETLLESELFGHVKGAFTGATMSKIGRFELADGGTLFLDEIGDLSPDIQVKLLRVLETMEFEKLGSSKSIKVDVRIIAATNRDLEQRIAQGAFRDDLFYRLNVINIHMPLLRDRREDILILVDHLIARNGKKLNKRIEGLTPEAKDILMSYSWPGNVRELINVIERASVLCRGNVLDTVDFSAISSSEQSPISTDQFFTDSDVPPLKDIEKKHILHVLEYTDWNFARTADLLGIHRNTLRLKIKEYGILKNDDE
ncbi:MAG: sigma-54 dependent transcriptional regulator [candidate division Zixibacteria bacterium]|nr:sigma-54 dependent transcriptional regulator [candidate division Zixibacteria bacterium]MBU1469926.1 sigma-54 dependent transcriptional regulator [candidate division Zixibacteria bacterium]MBU2626945.1 sigma-54 dependent transcriptional regulator [candidate division Zixibacteria bacterium]